MPSRFVVTVVLVACLGAGAVPAGARGFTFRDAEFLPDDAATEQAQAFVADRLPPGLPLAEARARLTAAAMSCDHDGREKGATTCDLGMVVHVDGGLLGEDRWRVRLVADAAGRLQTATLDHYIVGTGVPGLN